MQKETTTRRTFLRAAGLGAVSTVLPSTARAQGAAVPDVRPRFALTDAQKDRLNRALEPFHAKYDPAAKMLREPFHSPGYHTTLKDGTVHGTRSALIYAVALLDTARRLYSAAPAISSTP
jgi:hypothetical protein